MTRPLPSASRWDLLAICQAWVAYHQVDEVSPALETGRERHAFYERLGKGLTSEQAIAAAPEKWREMLARLPTDRFDVEPGAYRSEVAFALDPFGGPEAARFLGEGVAREVAYEKCPPGWIPLTVDRFGLAGATVVVRDFKGPWDEADHAWQIGIYVLAAAAFCWNVEAALSIVDHVGDGRGWSEKPKRWDALALAAFAGKLAVLARKAIAVMEAPETARPVVGPHCVRCPARLSCPAQRTAADVLVRREGEALSAGALRELALVWPALKARVRLVEELIKTEARAAYERGEPFTAPDGRVFRPWPEERPADDDAGAIEAELSVIVAERLGATDEQEPAVREVVAKAVKIARSVTSNGIREVARALAGKRGVGAVNEEIRERLRKASVVTPRETFEWRKQ